MVKHPQMDIKFKMEKIALIAEITDKSNCNVSEIDLATFTFTAWGSVKDLELLKLDLLKMSKDFTFVEYCYLGSFMIDGKSESIGYHPDPAEAITQLMQEVAKVVYKNSYRRNEVRASVTYEDKVVFTAVCTTH